VEVIVSVNSPEGELEKISIAIFGFELLVDLEEQNSAAYYCFQFIHVGQAHWLLPVSFFLRFGLSLRPS
jgi:hypothetical protein